MREIKVYLTAGAGDTTLTLPADADAALAAFREIGEEDGGCHISGCESGFGGRLDAMIAGADLDSVNYLAARLSTLSRRQTELLEAMLEHLPGVISNVAQAIDFTFNTGAYEIYDGVHGPDGLALYYINHSGSIEMPPEWVGGIDLVRFGKHLEKYEIGHYTKHGYLIATGLDWNPVFDAGAEVPPEYRITKK